MPKKITAETDVRILEEIDRHAEGIGMDTLHAYVEDAISRPRQMRTPVGYNQRFLETYYPNETSYLPAELRSQLHTLGTPPDGTRDTRSL